MLSFPTIDEELLLVPDAALRLVVVVVVVDLGRGILNVEGSSHLMWGVFLLCPMSEAMRAREGKRCDCRPMQICVGGLRKPLLELPAG